MINYIYTYVMLIYGSMCKQLYIRLSIYAMTIFFFALVCFFDIDARFNTEFSERRHTAVMT